MSIVGPVDLNCQFEMVFQSRRAMDTTFRPKGFAMNSAESKAREMLCTLAVRGGSSELNNSRAY
jgi:hypothetical protein